jgi:hypothetical protein
VNFLSCCGLTVINISPVLVPELRCAGASVIRKRRPPGLIDEQTENTTDVCQLAPQVAHLKPLKHQNIQVSKGWTLAISHMVSTAPAGDAVFGVTETTSPTLSSAGFIEHKAPLGNSVATWFTTGASSGSTKALRAASAFFVEFLVAIALNKQNPQFEPKISSKPPEQCFGVLPSVRFSKKKKKSTTT